MYSYFTQISIQRQSILIKFIKQYAMINIVTYIWSLCLCMLGVDMSRSFLVLLPHLPHQGFLALAMER